jgi:hypothetical protein
VCVFVYLDKKALAWVVAVDGKRMHEKIRTHRVKRKERGRRAWIAKNLVDPVASVEMLTIGRSVNTPELIRPCLRQCAVLCVYWPCLSLYGPKRVSERLPGVSRGALEP